ncbi:5-methyltetrahydropteroyltriglutamate--homocysteine S-methyltransferase [Candidatus Zinderia endosymbiont of Aphrophora alni]|uniref:5-methyltetrahydropteroyltriglutamate-- homocysteine S-methyltransferase n=1 Tax=Candidatus Zinderia endosymbiont of Aphrophora alni TaxID=3077951 RepID=UPI0030CEB310
MSVAHVLGFPRIGSNRELKFAMESFWIKKINEKSLRDIGKEICLINWDAQINSNMDYITVGDFSWYDHVLSTLVLFGAIPTRFKFNPRKINLRKYYIMARGDKNHLAMEMTKWFNTNYHYLVPEWSPDILFKGDATWLFEEIFNAYTKDKKIKVVLLGPLTLLYLGKIKYGLSHKLDLLPKLLISYKNIIRRLKRKDISLIQIEEPILTLELDNLWLDAFKKTYIELGNYYPFLLLTTYFDSINKENFFYLKELPIYGIHIDAVYGNSQLKNFLKFWPINKILSIGIVDGRNIWRSDLKSAFFKLRPFYKKFGNKLWISSSCSCLHVPIDLKYEKFIDSEIKSWLSFTIQKLDEIFIIKEAFFGNFYKIIKYFISSEKIVKSKKKSIRIHNNLVKIAIDKIQKININRNSTFTKRIVIQKKNLNLPNFPITTIGSFPQTSKIRKLRFNYKSGRIGYLEYLKKIKKEIHFVIKKQEEFGLDVLVHGESERNDMVEFFGEQLSGFGFTFNGWVQSYGSRCVKPPFIYGDVYRPKVMTTYLSEFAQSLTKKPVKGMLTGPITMLFWSFVRNDQEKRITALQIALALRKEVRDLEKAGISIIQIDEPALREGLPLKKSKWKEYLKWAIYAFKITFSFVNDKTQIHTHMCYSEFNDILNWIIKMDADVITIETAKSNMKLLNNFNYPNDIGPGIYDIHSPRIPNVKEISNLINKARNFIPDKNLWINPDCGLKTRSWKEISSVLTNIVKSVKNIR